MGAFLYCTNKTKFWQQDILKLQLKKSLRLSFLNASVSFIVGSCLKHCFIRKWCTWVWICWWKAAVCLLTCHSFATEKNYFDRSVSCCPAIQSCGKWLNCQLYELCSAQIVCEQWKQALAWFSRRGDTKEM